MLTMEQENKKIVTINTKNSDSRWVAIVNKQVISEGKTPEEALHNAKDISSNPFLMFIPKKGTCYVF